MSRERMVTRTVTQAKANCLMVNTNNGTTFTKEFVISNSIPENKRLKELQKAFDTENEKIVFINSVEISEILYGMSEQEFIKNAQILPNRVKHENE